MARLIALPDPEPDSPSVEFLRHWLKVATKKKATVVALAFIDERGQSYVGTLGNDPRLIAVVSVMHHELCERANRRRR